MFSLKDLLYLFFCFLQAPFSRFYAEGERFWPLQQERL